MPRPNAQERAQIAHRRTVVADRYLRRQTMMQIATALEVSVSVIHNDLQSIHAAWLRSSAGSISQHIAAELARIDRLESEHWRAWEESQKPKKSRRRIRGRMTGKHGGDKTEITLQREKRDGNPKFLQGIAWCIDRRCKLLGLDPVRDGNVNTGGGVIINLVPTIVVRNDAGVIEAPADQPGPMGLPGSNGTV